MITINFFGTHDFAAGILQALIDSADFEIKTVFTAPDRPVGRHQEIQKSAVKILAEKYNLPTEQPISLKNYTSQTTCPPSLRSGVSRRAPYSLNIVCDYGLIIPKTILDVPTHGSINIHPSLLPKYRGASPIQSAILNGETETGVTIMLMDEKLDHGSILAQKTMSINPVDIYTTLASKLLEMAKFLLVDTAKQWVNGQITPQPQDDTKATICHEFTRADGEVDWQHSSIEIYNQWRALNPWPGIWTMWNGKRLKLLSIRMADGQGEIGEIKIQNDQMFFGCKNGSIEVLELQVEGKKPMNAKEFINGYKASLHV